MSVPNLDRAPIGMPPAEIPIGYVMGKPNVDLGKGWHDCNGQMMTIVDYPDLYEAIKYRYTVESQQEEGKFRLPEVPNHVIKVSN